MRAIARLVTVTAAAALVTLGLAPAAAQAASRTVFTVWDAGGYEYYKQCSDTPPYPCGTFNGGTLVQVTVANPARPYRTITAGWQIVDITTTAGADYTGPTSGTLTIPAGQTVTTISIPYVNDGVAEPDETFRVRLTSSSVPGADISDTGIGTIWDGGAVPADCDLSRPDAQSVSMTCTNRPPTEQWYVGAQCGEEWPHFQLVNGNIVTGNGTSTARCTTLPFSSWYYDTV